MNSSKTNSSNRKSNFQLSKEELELFQSIHKSIGTLTLEYGWNIPTIFERLGYATYPSSDNSSVPSTRGVEIQTQRQKKRGSRESGSRKSDTSAGLNVVSTRKPGTQKPSTDEEDQSASKKRKNDSSTDPKTKRSRTDVNAGTQDQVVYPPDWTNKKRFELSCSPVLPGRKDKEGTLQEQPQGGPLGLLESLVRRSVQRRGKKFLTETLGMDIDSFTNVVSTLVEVVGSVDADSAAYAIRNLSAETAKSVLAAQPLAGCQYLTDNFGWDMSKEDVKARLASKSDRTIIWRNYEKYHEMYLVDLARSRSQQRRVPSDENSGSINMDTDN
jgi:hypothetical protein